MYWNMNLRSYMQAKLPLYVFVSVLFIIGVVFGALLVNALSEEQSKEMAQYLGQFFQLIEQEDELAGKTLFLETFKSHLKWLLLIGLLGISVIGLPVILILDFIKGVLLGFTVGYFVGQLSWKGMLFALVTIAPQNLIIIPAIIICSVSGISLSMFLVRNRLSPRRSGHLSQQFKSYVMMVLTLVLIVCGASLFEAFLTPVLMKWVSPMLLTI